MIERHAQKYIKFCQDMDKSLEETRRFLNQAGIWFVTATDTPHRFWSFVWLMLVDFSITVWNQSCQFAFSKLLNACVSLVCCLFVCCQDMPGIRVRIPISGRNWVCVPSLNMDQGPDSLLRETLFALDLKFCFVWMMDDSVTREHYCKKCFISGNGNINMIMSGLFFTPVAAAWPSANEFDIPYFRRFECHAQWVLLDTWLLTINYCHINDLCCRLVRASMWRSSKSWLMKRSRSLPRNVEGVYLSDVNWV